MGLDRQPALPAMSEGLRALPLAPASMPSCPWSSDSGQSSRRPDGSGARPRRSSWCRAPARASAGS